MDKIFLSELGKSFQDRDFLLIVGLGFDERSLSALKAIGPSSPRRVAALLNPARLDIDQALYLDEFKDIAGGEAVVIGDGYNSIVETIDSLQSFLLKEDCSESDIIFDITSLSHELLIAVVGLLAIEKILGRVTLIYTGAEKYSYNTSPGQQWLSRGVTEIRSVLGFPGLMLPSRKLHLIVLAGFEVERAAEIIARYEPARLTIAHGGKDQSVSEQHYQSNKQYVEEIRDFLVERSSISEGVSSFEFSCVDPFETCDLVCRYVEDLEGENIVICPLNTKVSTVGVALAGLKYPWLQICYAQAAEYNLQGYAKAGDSVAVISFSNYDISIGEF
ncbi:hypothetical protein QA447_11210 [Pseudomonas sp. abacavir_1]